MVCCYLISREEKKNRYYSLIQVNIRLSAILVHLVATFTYFSKYS